jgi:hypothetical protein
MPSLKKQEPNGSQIEQLREAAFKAKLVEIARQKPRDEPALKDEQDG